MSMQPYGPAQSYPAPQQPTVAAPGWYQNGHVQRYWDGGRWTEHVAPLQQAPPPQQIIVQQYAPRPRSVSGMSNGARLVNIIFCVCTLGLWAPFWLLMEWLSRRKVHY